MGSGGGGGGSKTSQSELDAQIKMNQDSAAAMDRQTQAGLSAANIAANAATNQANIQANAAINAAKIQADAANNQARMAMEAAKAQADASIKNSRMSATAGIMAAALAQNTTTEQIIRRLPVESGAATIQSWELAQQWQQNLSMTMQGYQPVAIDYKQSGRDGDTLHADATWNSLYMGNKIKDTAMSAIRLIGIKGPNNPNGVAINWDQWVQLNSMKHQDSVLQVDPAQAQARMAKYNQWKAQNPFLASLYENPQLAGQGIEGMLGKADPIAVSFDAEGNPIVSGGKAPATQNSAEIERMKQMGIIDANNMINGGALLNMIPAELRDAPEFNPMRTLSSQELVKLQDDWNAGLMREYDPKLISSQNLGFGVLKTQIYNADGSVAHSYMTGDMYLADGSVISGAVMDGTRLQEWYDFQGLANGMGPAFPGRSAPTENSVLRGEIGTSNRGMTAANAAPSPFMKNPYEQQAVPSQAPTNASGAAPASAGPAPSSKVVTPSIATMGSALMGAPSQIKPASTPDGYSGAPLAAGE